MFSGTLGKRRAGDTTTMNLESQQAAIYENAKKTALAILESGEPVEPVILFMREGSAGGLQLPTGIEPKEKWREMMRLIMKWMADFSDAFCFVTEVWTSSVPKDTPREDYTSPSDDPNRKEALLVTLYAKEKQICTAFLPFTRKDGKVAHEDKWIETGPGQDFETQPGSILPTDT